MTEVLRKKCAACGLIGFAADEACRRCGADKLNSASLGDEDSSNKTKLDKPRQTSLLVYPLSFALALMVEFIALLPILATLGTRHSANAPVSQWEIDVGRILFVLHLPSVLPAYLFNCVIPGNPMTVIYVYAPFTQLVFWTCLFVYGARKLEFRFRRDRSFLPFTTTP